MKESNIDMCCDTFTDDFRRLHLSAEVGNKNISFPIVTLYKEVNRNDSSMKSIAFYFRIIDPSKSKNGFVYSTWEVSNIPPALTDL